MKQILTIFFVVISFAALSQEGKQGKPAKDSANSVTDSTLIFSIRDIRPLYQALKQMHEDQPDEYKALIKSVNNPLLRFMDQLMAAKVEEYRVKSKTKKN